MLTAPELTWLLDATSRRDRAAFERLYAAACAKLYGVVLRILRRPDLAADVMEEAYLQIWKRAGEFDPGQSTPLAWMVAIARRLAIDLSRRPQPNGGNGEGELIDDNEGPGSVPRHQLTDDLKRLLTRIRRLQPDGKIWERIKGKMPELPAPVTSTEPATLPPAMPPPASDAPAPTVPAPETTPSPPSPEATHTATSSGGLPPTPTLPPPLPPAP